MLACPKTGGSRGKAGIRPSRDFYCTYWRSGLSRRPLVWQAMLSAAMLVAIGVICSFLAAL